MFRVRAAAALVPQPLWAGSLLAGAALLAGPAMGPRLLAELRFGPICSGHAAAALHCPACYAAAALVGAALVVLTRRASLV